MKTIVKFLILPFFLIAVSCSVESVTDNNEDLNAVSLKGKRKGNCDVKKERPSRNTYVGGADNTYSGTWGYPVGEFTGESFITGFVDNLDGTFTQTSIDEVTAENGDTFVTLSTVLIVPANPEFTTGTYTVNFIVDGDNEYEIEEGIVFESTGIFEGATGSFRVKNGVFNETGAYHNAIGKITSFGVCDD